MPNDAKIPYGFNVIGQNIGGLEKAKAKELLTSTVGQQQPDVRIILMEGQRRWIFDSQRFDFNYDFDKTLTEIIDNSRLTDLQDVVTLVQLQVRQQDVNPSLSWNEEALTEYLDNIGNLSYKPPKNARLEYQNTGELVLLKEEMGEELDYDVIEQKLLEGIHNYDGKNMVLELPKKTVVPDVLISDLTGIDEELSEYTAYLPNHRNRTHNIRLAVNAIDQTLIKPGETFSFNSVIGDVNIIQSGYLLAPDLLDIGLPDTVGGGISHLASAIYAAALTADLEVTERAPNFAEKPFLEELAEGADRDAVIAYGSLDLKIRNNFSHSVVITSSLENDVLTVRILGSSTMNKI
ncbi:MAG: VanW family protein [Syntrophomonadaceae bacterium]|jgi:vancomycin resistance protein YoaR|nr:VanW family protein [Syntrophomonadaceae bacterium]